MSNLPEDTALEDARRRLQAIIDSCSTSGAGLYLQQVAQAGLLALDTLPSCYGAQQLAEIIVQEVDDVYNLLQNIAWVDEGLENDLLEFLGVVIEIQEFSHLADGTVVKKLATLGENLQELSARIVRRIVANDDSVLANTEEEEASGPSSHPELAPQTANGNTSSMSNLLNPMNSPLSANTPHGNTGDPLSQSVAAVPDPPADWALSTLHLSQTLNAEETYDLGLHLLKVLMREGDSQNLSNSISLFQETLLCCSSDSRLRLMASGNLATALLIRYKREGSLVDLSEATERYREALELRPPGHPARHITINNLANTLFTRYECEGSLLDLSEATELHREALELRPPGHPDYASSLSNLAIALMARYKREGSLLDLSEATKRFREALELHPSGHPHHALSLNNLSTALMARYKCEGSLLDLSEATEMRREALGLRPPGHPQRALSLDNLSTALMARYKREGGLLDLSEAIENHREALGIRPPSHPDRATSLGNLSNALLARYHREGSLSDLSEATEQYRKALELRPPGNPDRASSLGNLSNALLIRYKREGSLLDLSEATEQYREALELRPPGHPDRALTLSNLSLALMARYQRQGSLLDLSEAIEHHREALQLRPPGHPDRASSFVNLSNALSIRHQRDGSLSDLSEAIEQRREVLKLRPGGHPERTLSLCSLSRTLLRAIDKTNDTSDLHFNPRALVQEIFEVLSEAVNLPSCPPLHRLRAALLWIATARRLAPDMMLDAYMAALDQLDIVLATRDTLENKHTQLISSEELSRCRELGVEAASYAARQGHMALAVELQERGRNLLFAQVGQYRVDLEELRKVDAELADRFSSLSSLLDASVVSNEPISEGRRVFEDSTERHREVSSAWSQAVNDIRAVEGFGHFLRAPNYTMLRDAAAEGPVIVVIQGNDQSDALIVTKERDTPHHVNLLGAGTEKLGELWLALIRAVHSDDGLSTEKSVKKVLRSLWTLVVQPIAGALENELHIPRHSRIWWCPTSFLSFLPLHAAGLYASKDTNLPDTYVSSYTSTLQALLRARHNRCFGKEEKMLIVAQPDTPGQSPLPNARPEAEIVKKEAERKMQTTLLISKEGTRAAVLNGIADHSWLHLICHGSQNTLNPFQSCFSLYDKELTLQDIIGRGLPHAEFAFLAACHTATGDIELSDEGLHLAAGLQFIGFRSVVGTIWEVADADGPVMAEAFYEALQPEEPEKEGMDSSRAAHALRAAVKKLRDSGVPIGRWMRFIHIGI